MYLMKINGYDGREEVQMEKMYDYLLKHL